MWENPNSNDTKKSRSPHRSNPFALRCIAQSPHHRANVIVYGGTASGVMTAYPAAKNGMHVILLEPGRHLGGMVTGGLSGTDVGPHPEIIGGYARDFYLEAASYYGVHGLTKHADWLSETPC